MKAALQIQTLNDGAQEIVFGVEDYLEADKQGITLAQLINSKYETDPKFGTAFEQCMIRTGLFCSDDVTFGIRPATLDAALGEGKYKARAAQLASSGSAIVRPDGTDRWTPAGRLFFPAVLIETIESELRDDRSSYASTFMRMVAQTRSINSSRYDQVIINLTGPRSSESMPIAQLAEPVRMLSITTASQQKSLPVYAIGLEWSDQAVEAATLDLVALAVREQGLEERTNRIFTDFMNIVNGNVDAGEAGIITNAYDVTDFDPDINEDGVITQKAWVKWLMKDWRRRRITHAVMDINTYLAVEQREGRPTKQFEPAQDERLNTMPQVMLKGIPDGVQVFLMDDFLANTIVGLDASKAMRRMVYAGAAYSAIEQFVMRRANSMRIDWSERIESAGYAQAWSTLLLNGAP